MKPFAKAPVTCMLPVVLPQLGGVGSDLLVASYSASPAVVALLCRAPTSTMKGLVDLHPAANSANASASAASSNAKAAAKRVKVYALASYESDPEWALVRT